MESILLDYIQCKNKTKQTNKKWHSQSKGRRDRNGDLQTFTQVENITTNDLRTSNGRCLFVQKLWTGLHLHKSLCFL